MVGAGDLACQLDRDVAAGHRQSCVAQERRNRTDSATGRIENDYGEHEMPERQVSLQELESKLDSYIHDVENGATVVVSRASGTFDWSGRRPKSRRPSVRLRDGGSVSDIIINRRALSTKSGQATLDRSGCRTWLEQRGGLSKSAVGRSSERLTSTTAIVDTRRRMPGASRRWRAR